MASADNYSIDTLAPAALALPDFLADTKYGDITSRDNCPFQRGQRTDQNFFTWLASRPKQLKELGQFMTAQRVETRNFLDVYPIEKQTQNIPHGRPLFVDIGGSVGHQCRTLKAAHPKIPGRVILQDLAPTLEHALPIDGVETMAHDFFTPQPVQGAKFYYLRNVLHDHTDQSCQTILKHTKAAMSEDSVILIDEMVLPKKGVHWRAAQLDIMLMSAGGAIERLEQQWVALLHSVGLKIEKIYTYTDLLKDSVIAVVPI